MPRMQPNPPLPAQLDVEPGHITVLLFSQPGCEFCAEVREHYLRPMVSASPRPFTIAEADLESSASIRNWRGQDVAQRDFARASGARFAPTVMFFDARGRSLAEPIVGLSKDFFGAFLEQRLRSATKAARTGGRA